MHTEELKLKCKMLRVKCWNQTSIETEPEIYMSNYQQWRKSSHAICNRFISLVGVLHSKILCHLFVGLLFRSKQKSDSHIFFFLCLLHHFASGLSLSLFMHYLLAFNIVILDSSIVPWSLFANFSTFGINKYIHTQSDRAHAHKVTILRLSKICIVARFT